MEDNIIHKKSKLSFFDDITVSAKEISQSTSIFLGEEIEELNVSDFTFRSGMERAMHRMLTAILKKPQKCLIFPDTIPGFTVVSCLKVEIKNRDSIKTPPVKRNPVEEPKEFGVLNSIIDNYFSKNQQKVLLIENEEIILAMFPVADTRKNLKELDFYITY